jgi:hypothetical protein
VTPREHCSLCEGVLQWLRLYGMARVRTGSFFCAVCEASDATCRAEWIQESAAQRFGKRCDVLESLHRLFGLGCTMLCSLHHHRSALRP